MSLFASLFSKGVKNPSFTFFMRNKELKDNIYSFFVSFLVFGFCRLSKDKIFTFETVMHLVSFVKC